MSAELEAGFPDIEITLLPEGKGIFDVIAEGETIYSKYEMHRFPNAGEITGLLAG